MSDPLFNDTINNVKGKLHEATTSERDWWTRASTEARSGIITGMTDIKLASEHAYQQEHTAKFNQLISTNYDSLPQSVKTSITEALIVEGELPNPSDFNGIGQAFEVGGEMAMECDRCDETFMSTEDFDMHKDIDHGDDTGSYNDAEESYEFSMSPNVSREAFREARRIVTEGDQGDLHRSVYFNGKDLPQPTKLEPDDVKGEKGYNDNPNEGLYDNKIFKPADSKQRNAIEAQAVEAYGVCDICGRSPDNHANPNTDYRGLRGDAPATDHYYYETDDGVESMSEEFYADGVVVEADNYPQKKGDDEWEDTLAGLKDEYASNETKYDEAEGMSEIKMVNVPSATDEAPSALENVCFAEENIDFVYPTLKEQASESFATEDHLLDDYSDGDIDTDDQAVEVQISERKMAGYGAQAIAQELVIQYGVSIEEALEKAYSVEVSVNDRVANTIFGKKYNQCTEAEKTELKLYSGSTE